ncbi:MAG: phenylacetate--CoA ligase [Spirochaetales bacterium]|jgi:phenylacetate-CoA ligase|nr:phenylacetate--CoA ligase [Spirochaetales bacterium]
MIWNPEAECMPPYARKRLQLANLKNLVEKVYDKVPFYRRKFEELGITPRDIHNLEDMAKLPFTTKDDLRETYPYGLLAVPEAEIEEIHMSSGTTGIPVVDAYTRKDIEIWGEGMARTLSMAGGRRNDIVQNAYGYGLFTGGMGAHYGAKTIGANVIPMSAGNTQKQIQVMKDFGSTMLTCTPSYALFLGEAIHEAGHNIREFRLRAGCFGAEPWSENMRKEIELKLNIKAYDIYGLTEITGPGVSSECEMQNGLHINEDLFYPEIIDPVTGQVLAEGEKGELVFTTLTKEGTPLIRYRTRDITCLFSESCPCGRTTIKMHRLFGRTDDMLIIRGVNVFPSQVEQVLIAIEGTDPHYQIILTRGESHLDEMEIMVEVQEKFFTDETRGLEVLRAKIETEIRSKLGVHAKIKLVEPKTIERSIGKAKRVIDKRVI